MILIRGCLTFEAISLIIEAVGERWAFPVTCSDSEQIG